MTRLGSLFAALMAGLARDARVRIGVMALALMGAVGAGLAGWSDPARAYAVAHVELSILAPPAAAIRADYEPETPTSDTHDSIAPRPVLRSAVREPAPQHDPVMELRPSVDHAVEPRLAGVEDLGGASQARAAAPSPASGRSRDDALTPAPIQALARSGPGGLLPRVGADGATPAEAYARPFEDDGTSPLVSVAIGGLGLNAAVTNEAIDTLPGEVTLSFVPYADRLQHWIDRARAAGHEVMIELPMEPYDYPANDPGPHTLLARADPDENHRRLDWLMSRATGYFAVMNYLGARFTAEPTALGPVLDAIAGSGVAFLYDGEARRSELDRMAVHAGLDIATADRILDSQPSAAAIDEELLRLEAIAIQSGDAIGAGFGYPVTVRQLRDWSDTLRAKGYRLAPVSAVLARRAAMTQIAIAEAEEAAPPTLPNFSSVPAGFGGGREGEENGQGHGQDEGDHSQGDAGGHH